MKTFTSAGATWEPVAPGELERDFPALWAAFGARYRDHLASGDYDDPLAGFVRSAEVKGWAR